MSITSPNPIPALRDILRQSGQPLSFIGSIKEPTEAGFSGIRAILGFPVLWAHRVPTRLGNQNRLDDVFPLSDGGAIIGNSSYVSRVDARGILLWESEAINRAWYVVADEKDKRVLVAGGSSGLVMFDLNNGEKIDDYTSSSIIRAIAFDEVNQRVYAGNDGGDVIRISYSSSSMSVTWSENHFAQEIRAMTYKDGYGAIATDDSGVIKVINDNGDQSAVNDQDIESGIRSISTHPSVTDQILVGTRDGYVHSLGIDGLTHRWGIQPTGADIYGVDRIDAGNVIAVDGDCNIIAIDDNGTSASKRIAVPAGVTDILPSLRTDKRGFLYLGSWNHAAFCIRPEITIKGFEIVE